MNSLVLIFPGNDEDNDPEGEENIDHNNVHEDDEEGKQEEEESKEDEEESDDDDDAADRKEAEENAEEGGEDDDAKEKEDENFKLALSLIAEREGVNVHNRHNYKHEEWDVASSDNKGIRHGYKAVAMSEVESVEVLKPMNLRVESSTSSSSSRYKVVSKKAADSLKVHWVYRGKRLKILM